MEFAALGATLSKVGCCSSTVEPSHGPGSRLNRRGGGRLHVRVPTWYCGIGAADCPEFERISYVSGERVWVFVEASSTPGDGFAKTETTMIVNSSTSRARRSGRRGARRALGDDHSLTSASRRVSRRVPTASRRARRSSSSIVSDRTTDALAPVRMRWSAGMSARLRNACCYRRAEASRGPRASAVAVVRRLP